MDYSPTYHHLSLLFFLLLILISLSEQTQTAAHSKHHEKHHHHHHHHHSHNFRPTSLFVFGDSYVDTGNSKNKGNPNAWKSPYGSTFLGKPAGRFSNGRVLTDFFARYMGLKSPLAYKMRNMVMAKKILRRGMNFAFGDAGVFDTYSGIPNVSTHIDDLEDLIKHKVYTSVDLNNSVALLSVAGNDYANYKATNHSFKRQIGDNRRILKTHMRGTWSKKETWIQHYFGDLGA